MPNNHKKINHPIICLVGPTAVGKSSLALKLAQKINAEIINADSRQFYKEMNIGTAKPTKNELALVPHHLINCAFITKPMSVAAFVSLAENAINKIHQSGKTPLIVGGTGMYFRSLVYGLSNIPEISSETRQKVNDWYVNKGLGSLHDYIKEHDLELFKKLKRTDSQRIKRAVEVFLQTGKSISTFWDEEPPHKKYDHLSFCLYQDRELMYKKINDRVHKMIKMGLKEEVYALYQAYPDNQLLSSTIGYAEWEEFGFNDVDQVVSKIQQNTRRFAKRQMTWFRKENDVLWVNTVDQTKAFDEILKNTLHKLK